MRPEEVLLPVRKNARSHGPRREVPLLGWRYATRSFSDLCYPRRQLGRSRWCAHRIPVMRPSTALLIIVVLQGTPAAGGGPGDHPGQAGPLHHGAAVHVAPMAGMLQ